MRRISHYPSKGADRTLLRGAPLAIAKEYLAKRDNDLTSVQRGFIRASINFEAREAARALFPIRRKPFFV